MQITTGFGISFVVNSWFYFFSYLCSVVDTDWVDCDYSASAFCSATTMGRQSLPIFLFQFVSVDISTIAYYDSPLYSSPCYFTCIFLKVLYLRFNIGVFDMLKIWSKSEHHRVYGRYVDNIVLMWSRRAGVSRISMSSRRPITKRPTPL